MAETKKESSKIKIWEVELKDETIRVDGISPILSIILEDEKITYNDIQNIGSEGSVENQSYRKLFKMLYYLVVHTSHTEKYRNLNFDEFMKLLPLDFKVIRYIEMISDIYVKHIGVTQKQIDEYQDIEKKKLNSPKSISA